ncbi:urease accessory protein UreD [Cellulomonas sp. zg-ZUI222]|uniref:Urease accessory protein UreD n=1 Tax=Cellulomonas wangleii TaxID=2816956 RepID=A0ABX8D6I0_9CELL|nr:MULTISPECIES: urease accessory protein UreD [Cellulomonas]MBO0901244.1 urease accessory protein UreD [Cellulomonas sp. zg-ZUI22]MBO0922447.1 urease accessory protein UreD [Cellulomonas wangleii]MBO0924888.1 urease accessory protein UreD [Cellulomonas wangleii]QVI63053.1 urease accessory protein UreD [Cellulomonas wangleii]
MTRTRVVVTADGDVEVGGDVARARRLADEHGRVRVALLGPTGPLDARDDVRIEVDVAPGRSLELVELTGAAAHDMAGGRATWLVDVRLGADAVLLWPSLPFLVADGADVLRLTHVDLAPGARVVLRETLVLGRPGERAGRVRSTVRARLAEQPLLAETVVLEPAPALDPLLADGGRRLDTLLLLGARLDLPGALQLEGEGTMLRAVGPPSSDARLAGALTAAVGVASSVPGHGSWAGTRQVRPRPATPGRTRPSEPDRHEVAHRRG